MLKVLCDGTVFADATAPGPARVIALHGWGRDRGDLRAACSDHSALLLDLPGFGASPVPDTAWGTDTYAEHLLTALRANGPAVLVAHSFGGRIAIRLAAQHPELVQSLVLTGVPLLPRTDRKKPPRTYRLVRALAGKHLLPAAALTAARARYGSADYTAASGILRDIMVKTVNETYDHLLPDITCPVTLVWGSNDSAVPVEVAERAAAMLPAATLHVVDGAGHALPITHAAALRTAVNDAVAAAIAAPAP